MNNMLLNKHADQISRELSKKLEKIISDHAARGFEQINGLAVQQVTEAGSTAMQALYTAALTIVPSLQKDEVTNFLASFDGSLNSLAESAISRAELNSSPELSTERQSLVQKLKAQLSGSGSGG